MSTTNDPVKDALKTLRSRQWSGDPLNIELEEKLMEQFQSHNAGSRRGRHRAVAVALGAVLICSVGFAAVKFDTIKSWLVTVEINGEVTEVELTQLAPGEPAEATFTVDTDSGQAQVAIQRWDDPSGEQGMQVHVITDGEDGAAFETMDKVVRRVISDAQPQNYTLEDIGDAEPAAEWRDQDDNEWKLYLVQGEDGYPGGKELLEPLDLIEALCFPAPAILAVHIEDEGRGDAFLEDSYQDQAGEEGLAGAALAKDPVAALA